MMFTRNCPDPELSSVFKCKPISKWSVEEIQESIDEHQRQSRSCRIPSTVKPRNFQVSTATAGAVPSVEVMAINIAAIAPSSRPKTVGPVSPNSDALERVLSLLESQYTILQGPFKHTELAFCLAVSVETQHTPLTHTAFKKKNKK